MDTERNVSNQTRQVDNSYEISDANMFLSVTLWIIFVVAFIGNSLVLLLGIRGRIKSARVPTFLICSLATADLLLAIFVIWTTAALLVFPKWIFGLVWCKLYLFFRGTMCMASIGTMAVIALERFLKVVCSQKWTLTLLKARMLVAYVWIHCIVTSSPWLIWAQIVHTGPTTRCINVNAPVMQAIFSTSLRVINYFIPLIFTWIAYIAILIKMWRSKRKVAAHTNSNGGQTSMARKVTLMCITVLMTFTLTWTPVQTVLFVNVYADGPNPDVITALKFTSALANLNSLLNPLVYGLMWQPLRNAVKQMLGCRVDNEEAVDITKTSKAQGNQHNHSKENQSQCRLGGNGMATTTMSTDLSMPLNQEPNRTGQS